jgi:hypothetical protein
MRYTDVVAQLHDFGFGQDFADVALTGLQFCRSVDDSLERFAVELRIPWYQVVTHLE